MSSISLLLCSTVRASAPSHSPALRCDFAALIGRHVTQTNDPVSGRDRDGRRQKFPVSTVSTSSGVASHSASAAHPHRGPIAPSAKFSVRTNSRTLTRRGQPLAINPLKMVSLRHPFRLSVKHLWIELWANSDNLLSVTHATARFEPDHCDFDVVKIALLHGENDNTLMRHRV
jgi:hypothetical protein